MELSPVLQRLIGARQAFIDARMQANEASLKVIAAQKEWSMAKDDLAQEDNDLLVAIPTMTGTHSASIWGAGGSITDPKIAPLQN